MTPSQNSDDVWCKHHQRSNLEVEPPYVLFIASNSLQSQISSNQEELNFKPLHRTLTLKHIIVFFFSVTFLWCLLNTIPPTESQRGAVPSQREPPAAVCQLSRQLPGLATHPRRWSLGSDRLCSSGGSGMGKKW